jgi:uncharacterized circularly permuted ATP-grasp superfamily protein
MTIAHDEAALPGGPAEAYADLLTELGDEDLPMLGETVAARLAAQGCVFDGRPFRVDPVPRLLGSAEWADLGAGLAQRVRALDAFVADAHGARAAVREGVVPARLLEGSDHVDPIAAQLPAARLRIGVAGMDLVRDADGRLLCLEDNVRAPSGMAYAVAARRAVGEQREGGPPPGELERALDDLLCGVLCAAAQTCAELAGASIALLSDGPSNTAHWEHSELARLLDLPLVTLADLRVRAGRLEADTGFGRRPIDVLYRRTDEEHLGDGRGGLTAIGEALVEPLRAGTLALVNAPGAGVADDKLTHAYADDLIRFFCAQEPLLPSVSTYDLGDAGVRAHALGRLDELVIKPRGAAGGAGVLVGPEATAEELRRAREAIEEHPHGWVAQETVALSTHPTVIGDRLAPRHVDLRPFVFFDGREARALPGALTRTAFGEGDMVVNSSREGGAKDTWIVA